jgi:uncharacterized protein YndB with AHSA1/START domain
MTCRQDGPREWFPGITIPADPDSTLHYTWDCSQWPSRDHPVESYQVIPVDGAQVLTQAIDDSRRFITLKVSGPAEGEKVGVTVRATSSGPNPDTDDRTVWFRGTQR